MRKKTLTLDFFLNVCQVLIDMILMVSSSVHSRFNQVSFSFAGATPPFFYYKRRVALTYSNLLESILFQSINWILFQFINWIRFC